MNFAWMRYVSFATCVSSVRDSFSSKLKRFIFSSVSTMVTHLNAHLCVMLCQKVDVECLDVVEFPYMYKISFRSGRLEYLKGINYGDRSTHKFCFVDYELLVDHTATFHTRKIQFVHGPPTMWSTIQTKKGQSSSDLKTSQVGKRQFAFSYCTTDALAYTVNTDMVDVLNVNTIHYPLTILGWR